MKSRSFNFKTICTVLFLIISFNLSAQIQRQLRSITDFTELDIEGGFNVHLLQGDEEKVIIETTIPEVFNTIKTTNNSGTLTVRSTGLDTGGSYKVALYIYFKNLDAISARLMSGSIDGYTQLVLERMNLTINGAMMVKFNLTCSDLQLNLSNIYTCLLQGMVTGNADFTLKDIKTFYTAYLQTESLSINCTEIKKANVWANREINVEAYGVGNLHYKGNAIEGSMNVKPPFTVVKD